MAQTQDKPAVDVNSPEFKQALAAEVSKVEARLVDMLAEKLTSMQATAKTLPSGDDKNFLQELAMNLSNLADQGTGRKPRVAPEVLTQRAKARERMVDLIVQARAEGKKATYAVTGKIYFGFRVIEPNFINRDKSIAQTHIDWDGVPNDALEPINETAMGIFQAFKDSVGLHEWKPPEDRLGVTKNGLVVRGAAADAAKRYFDKGAIDSSIGEELVVTPDGSLNVHHARHTGQMHKVNILGDIAPPAQRMA